jgi:hypothetical protein
LHGEAERQPALLIDAHVHLHDCFPPASFLEHAERNFERAASQGQWERGRGVLMLTESAGVDWFGRLAAMGAGNESGRAPPLAPWRIEETGDPAALVARNGPRRLFLIAGRQVVAREGLEVLLLGTRATMADGRPIREVLAEGERLGALRVIPWGAGKWLFARARLLSDLVAEMRRDPGFFLGDGAGRPFFWTRPRHFEEARRRGVRILSGTDPLPFASEVGRAGSYGFRLDARLDLTRPGEAIVAALRDPSSRITPYGRLERLTPFVRHQLAMQRLKRRRPTA